MNSSTATISDATRVVRDAVRELISCAHLRSQSDADLIEFVRGAGDLLRATECALSEASGEIEARSQAAAREERLAVRSGCRNANDLLQVATGVSAATAAKWLRVAAATRSRTAITAELLPSTLPGLREAMAAGAVGIDGALAVAGPLVAAFDRADPADFAAADESIAAVALAGKGNSLPLSVDELKAHATAWACALDQDGSEPADLMAAKRRGVTLGTPRDGLVPISGMLLTEVAAQFHLLDAAINNPRVINRPGGVRFQEAGDPGDPPRVRDTRTPAQRRHDALATALGIAAASDDVPTIGGSAPVLVVQVAEADLIANKGWARIDGSVVPLAVARHAGCGATVQRVAVNAAGAITRIGTEERVFNRHQRRAIALRDGGCVIPGCSVASAWCELHHVRDHALGGATHVDNGVLLCWEHHRYLDSNGYAVRMTSGVPEVQLPRWIDPSRSWHPATPPPPNIRPTPRT